MSRVFVVCTLVVQTVLFLFLKGNHEQEITFNFINFFIENKFLLIYLSIINVATFIAFAIDKYNAITHRSRIRNVTLLVLSFFGGSVGGLLGMYLLRHKIKKDYFSLGLPMILVTQVILIFYLMNIQ